MTTEAMAGNGELFRPVLEQLTSIHHAALFSFGSVKYKLWGKKI